MNEYKKMNPNVPTRTEISGTQCCYLKRMVAVRDFAKPLYHTAF